jgi:vesicle coat complex subunit
MKSDLVSGNETNEGLVLSTLGNLGSAELAKELSAGIIFKAFTDDRQVPVSIRKKAVLCLLSFIRR